MTDQHPITPPSELVQQWEENWHHSKSNIELELYMAAQASQWGYDQCGEVNEAKLQQARDEELEACCRELEYNFMPDSGSLRTARRPKPPSLKKQALEELDKVGMLWDTEEFGQKTLNSLETIRRALEALPDD